MIADLLYVFASTRSTQVRKLNIVSIQYCVNDAATIKKKLWGSQQRKLYNIFSKTSTIYSLQNSEKTNSMSYLQVH